MNCLPRLAIILFIILITLTPAYAQDQKLPDARDFVLQALENTSELSGYQFTYEATTASTYVSRNLNTNDFQFTVYQILTLEGKAAANGNNNTSITVMLGRNQEDAEETPVAQVERIVIEGESALNFQLQNSYHEHLTDIGTGWRTYDEHLNAAERSDSRSVIEVMNKQPLPTEFLTPNLFINTITELEPEVIDEISLRVFDVAIDGNSYYLQRLLQRSPHPLAKLMEYLLETLTQPRIIESNVSYRLWIGADDQQIYNAILREDDTTTHMQATYQGYDTVTTSEINMRLWAHNEPVEIEPVILAN